MGHPGWINKSSGTHPRKKLSPVGFDFNERPFLVIWETTLACPLACKHCRATAQPEPGSNELTIEEGRRIVKETADMGTPILIFSGGDPLKRADLLDLIKYGKSLGLHVATIPAASSTLSFEKVKELKDAGIDQLAFSLDAPTAELHDGFRQVPGTFDITMQAASWTRELEIPLQFNSVVGLHNIDVLDELLQLVASQKPVFWEVFFLVPTGRGQELKMMSTELFEEAFAKIYDLSKRVDFLIKVTEAPQYRRYYYARELEAAGADIKPIYEDRIDLPEYLKTALGPRGTIGRAPKGVNAGKGFVFINHQGEVMPSGFLPVSAGNIRNDSLGNIYRNSPLMKELRNTKLLKGKCGLCPYKDMCGGSRSRAYAMTGDYLAEVPFCSFAPATAQVVQNI
jgi:radical SAM protein